MSDSLFNQLLNQGYRITFTMDQVTYTTPDGEFKTARYSGDLDTILRLIAGGDKTESSTEDISNLLQQIVNHFKYPAGYPLTLTCPLGGGLVRVTPTQQLPQSRDLMISFEGVKEAQNYIVELGSQLQINGLSMSWVGHPQYPTLLIRSGWSTQQSTSGPMPFGMSGF